MSTLPPCPSCNSEYTYEDGAQLVCPECAHEWSATGASDAVDDTKVIKDSVGNVLQDGDTITVTQTQSQKVNSHMNLRNVSGSFCSVFEAGMTTP